MKQQLEFQVNDCFISKNGQVSFRIIGVLKDYVYIDCCAKRVFAYKPFLQITRHQAHEARKEIERRLANGNFEKITLTKFNRIWNRKNYEKLTTFYFTSGYVKFGEKNQ